MRYPVFSTPGIYTSCILEKPLTEGTENLKCSTLIIGQFTFDFATVFPDSALLKQSAYLKFLYGCNKTYIKAIFFTVVELFANVC